MAALSALRLAGEENHGFLLESAEFEAVTGSGHSV
jgi:hypothetical protein